MAWKRVRHLYRPEASDWTHASNPIALPLGPDQCIVYYNSRDSRGRAHVFSLTLNLKTLEVSKPSPSPVLGPGAAGLFDDNGVSLGSVVRVGNEWRMYYLGWNLGITVPWRNAIGYAVARELSGPWTKTAETPTLDRSRCDPYGVSYPCVYAQSGSYQMIYGRHRSWGIGTRDEQISGMLHVLARAQSPDGSSWIPVEGEFLARKEDENAFSRPCVAAAQELWFCLREKNGRYKIGYARSSDGGKSFERDDAAAGLNPSHELGAWDGSEVSYPSVLDHEGRRFLFYCGDGYGRAGFGLAEWQ